MRRSLLSLKSLASVMSQLFIQIGAWILLPDPALPKQSIVWRVKLHGTGGRNAAALSVWKKSTWLDGSVALPTTNRRAPSAEPVKFGEGLLVLVPVKEMPGTPM